MTTIPAAQDAKANTGQVAAILTTAIAPAIWGTTYYVTTALLPQGYPLTVAMLRALPAGLLLLAFVRTLPNGIWWGRTFILGALNFSVFWAMLFISAYRLPGGVAATLGAVQPLIVIALARLVLGRPVRPLAVLAGIGGVAGIALIVLTPKAALDPVGIAAGLAGILSLACGTVLSRHWQPPVSSLTFAAWQLTAGGLLLIPAALLLEPALPIPTTVNLIGFAWLSVIGGALTYIFWFRGLARIEPSAIASLGLLSPLVATAVGWLLLNQDLTPLQLGGFFVAIISLWLSQRAAQAR
ncbi:EamA family transporter [Mycobacterium sp. KBS0706]|uniref:EamA family transporter n=1 Tax=Mycobacterium sp. KBS0706 TaxID=2578109 RepID=UPI0027D2C52A|nr:EamA family transporter [Mycobacterium sp. KBS0706]